MVSSTWHFNSLCIILSGTMIKLIRSWQQYDVYAIVIHMTERWFKFSVYYIIRAITYNYYWTTMQTQFERIQYNIINLSSTIYTTSNQPRPNCLLCRNESFLRRRKYPLAVKNWSGIVAGELPMVSQMITRRNEKPWIIQVFQWWGVDDQVCQYHQPSSHDGRCSIAGCSPCRNDEWGHVRKGELGSRYGTGRTWQDNCVESVMKSMHPIEMPGMHYIVAAIEQYVLYHKKVEYRTGLLQ